MRRLVSILMLIIISGCGAKHSGEAASGINQEQIKDRIDDETDMVSFANDIKPLFVVKCSICHNIDSALINVLDYETAKNNSNRIFDSVVVKKTMPQVGSMTELERELVSKWVDDGALE